MAKGYYTVIVGTQPGVYRDWTQAAPKVSEIPGAIHKKSRTLAEAWDAYNIAAREGTLRAVRMDPEPRAESPPPGSQAQEVAPHEYPLARPTRHSAAGLGHRFRSRASSGAEIIPSMHAGPSHLPERLAHGTLDTERREHQYYGQESLPADRVQALRPIGSSNRGHGTERRQESHRMVQHGSVRPLSRLSSSNTSRTVIAREGARTASVSPERRRRVLGSPSAAHPRPPSSSHATHGVLRSTQMEDNRQFPGNVASQRGRPPSASPLAGGRLDEIGSRSSDRFSFDFQPSPVNRSPYLEPSRASGSQGPIANPVASPRVHGMSDKKGKKRASVQSPDAYVESFHWSEIQRRPSLQSLQTAVEIGDPSSPPASLHPSPACSHISLTSSDDTLSVFSFDINISVVETPASPGRSAHIASSPPPLPVPPPFATSDLVEHAVPGPSSQGQEGLDEENGDNSQGSDDTIVEDVVDNVEPTDSPHADRLVVAENSPSLSRPLSPLIVASTSRSPTHLTQSVRPSGLDTATSSSSRRLWSLWPPSLSPYVDREASRSTEVTGLGLSIEGVMSPSPHGRPQQHRRTTTPASPGSPPHQLAGNIEGPSPTGQDASPRDPPASQALVSPPHLSSAVSDLEQQSGGARSTNGAAPSPRNVPLPSSPTPSTTGSPVRLQAQPSHRISPLMPFYPSLADDDDDLQQPAAPPLLSPPSHFQVDDIAFGRPTPRSSLISIQVPEAVPVTQPVASPSRTTPTDPRSPISRLTRIPGSVIGITRNFFFGRPTPPRNDSDGRE